MTRIQIYIANKYKYKQIATQNKTNVSNKHQCPTIQSQIQTKILKRPFKIWIQISCMQQCMLCYIPNLVLPCTTNTNRYQEKGTVPEIWLLDKFKYKYKSARGSGAWGSVSVVSILGFQFSREEDVYLGNIYARLPRGIFRCGYLLRILRGSLHSW